jgi:hypothetical protein
VNPIMSETECPICMNCIEPNTNCATTECGHRFHSSCLIKNIAHNGFCCPNCRTTMAEQVDDDSDDDDSDYYDDADSEGAFEDRMMRGFRMFFDNAHGEEHDVADVREEVEEQEEEYEDQGQMPSIEYITNKLSPIISYSDLVSALMSQHAEFERRVETYDSDNRIYGLIRSIIARYDPNPNPNPASQPVQVKKYVQNTESCIDIFV